MKTIRNYILLGLLSCVAFTSCNGEDKKARAFVDHFTEMVISGNSDSIAAVYPAAEKVMKKAGNCNIRTKFLESRNVKVKDLGDGQWRATIGDSVKVNFTEGKEEGTFIVKESFGLIDYGTERMNFARATGWIESSMSDVKIGRRLCETEFIEWISGDFLENLKKNIHLAKTGTFGDERDGGTWICSDGIIMTITNYNDFAIPSDSYELVCSDWCRALPQDTSMVSVPGQDIPAHGKSVQRIEILTTMESASTQEIRYDDSALIGILFANYKAKGNEYKEFKRSGGKRVESEQPDETVKKVVHKKGGKKRRK